MKSDLPQELRYRIEKDYADFLEEISGLRPEEWLRRGEEIVLYKNLYRELLSGGGMGSGRASVPVPVPPSAANGLQLGPVRMV